MSRAVDTSKAGRLAVPLFFAGLCCAIFLSPAASAALELRPCHGWSEPWRLATGHLTHWSAGHLGWNLLIFFALAGFFPPRRLGALLAGSAVVVGLGVALLYPYLSAYRGLSGLDSALFAALALDLVRRRRRLERWLGWLALVFFATKILAELMAEQALFAAGPYLALPAAHLLGAAAGLAEAFFLRPAGAAAKAEEALP